eukprot:IDg4277t1
MRLPTPRNMTDSQIPYQRLFSSCRRVIAGIVSHRRRLVAILFDQCLYWLDLSRNDLYEHVIAVQALVTSINHKERDSEGNSTIYSVWEYWADEKKYTRSIHRSLLPELILEIWFGCFTFTEALRDRSSGDDSLVMAKLAHVALGLVFDYLS